MKLWPFRAATRAGQNAIRIQMMKRMIEPTHQPFTARIISASMTGTCMTWKP